MSDEKKAKLKSVIFKFSIINIIAIILLLIVIGVFVYFDSKMNKIIFNGKELPTSYNGMVKQIGDEKYISIEKFINSKSTLSPLVMYSKQNGRYDSKSSSGGSFFITTPYEAVQFNVNEDTFTKYIKFEYLDRMVDEKGKVMLKKDEETKEGSTTPLPREKTQMDSTILDQEKFKLSRNLVVQNGNTYISLQDAKYTFNMKFRLSQDNKKLYIETVDYLEKTIAGQLDSLGLSLSENYQNRRAIVDDYVVVLSGESYGINKVAPNKSITENLIPIQYKDLRFVQSDNSSTVYLINNDKQVALMKVDPPSFIINFGNFDTLEVYSQDKGLYLVSSGGKYGIINDKAVEVVPKEFDKIGYDLTFFENEKYNGKDVDGKVILDKLIPVMKDQKWGFYDADGISNVIVPPLYLMDLGSKKLKLLPKNTSDDNRVEIPKEEQEKLELNGVKVSSTLTPEEALKYGYTTDPSLIRNGDGVFIVPITSELTGVVVKNTDGLYGIVSLKASKNAEYILPANYKYIYKSVSNGQTKYYAEDLFGETLELNAFTLGAKERENANENMSVEAQASNTKVPETKPAQTQTTPPTKQAPVQTRTQVTQPQAQQQPQTQATNVTPPATQRSYTTPIPGVEDEFGNNLNKPRFDKYGNPLLPNTTQNNTVQNTTQPRL